MDVGEAVQEAIGIGFRDLMPQHNLNCSVDPFMVNEFGEIDSLQNFIKQLSDCCGEKATHESTITDTVSRD